MTKTGDRASPLEKDEKDKENKPVVEDRSISNRPVDAHRMGQKSNLGLPPGISTDEAIDPGRMTPEAPATDDES